MADCPGFNDTKRSDTEILQEIAKVLSTQYLLVKKLRLRGILFLRDITSDRMGGSDVRTLDIFTRLVGKSAFPHVVFVTTKWGRLDAEGKKAGYRKERELKNDFWREIILDGATATRFHGSRDSAEGIISQLVGDAEPVTLQIQRELIDREMELAATKAGAMLVPEVEQRLGESKGKLQRFRERLSKTSNGTEQRRVLIDIQAAEEEIDKAQSDRNRLKEKVGFELKKKIKDSASWQEALRTVCSVVGVVLSIVIPVATGTCKVM